MKVSTGGQQAGWVFLASFGVVVAVIAVGSGSGQIASSLEGLALGPLLGACACQFAALLMRVEVWRTCLAAVEGQVPPRFAAQRASGLMFVCGLVSRPLGQAARIAGLRRLAPATSPSAPQMLAADAAAFVVEAALVLALTVVTLGGAAGLTDVWWLALLALAGALVVLLALRSFGARGGLAQGLSVLRDRQRLVRVGAQLAVVIGLQLVRNALLLGALGVGGAIKAAALLFVGMSAAGALPSGALGAPLGALATLGPATGAAASLAVLGVVSATALGYAVLTSMIGLVRR